MPTACPPLQIYAAAELAGAIFSLSVVSHDEIHCPSNDTPIPWLSHLLISCLHLGMPQEEVPLAQWQHAKKLLHDALRKQMSSATNFGWKDMGSSPPCLPSQVSLPASAFPGFSNKADSEMETSAQVAKTLGGWYTIRMLSKDARCRCKDVKMIWYEK